MKALRGRGPTRGTLALVLGVAAVFAVATVVSRLVFEGPASPGPALPTRPAAPGTAPGRQTQLFRVAAIEGAVETQHGGQWYLVQAGDFLAPEDVLRTPPGTRAIVRRGSTEVEIRENVDIRLDRLADATTARFDLLRGGKVSATVGEDGETLAIAAQESETVNQGAARWVVALNQEGRVHVAAAAGEVRFAARGKEVLVGAGQESAAAPGQAPSEPSAIPDDLLLSVFWPERDDGAPAVQVKGTARPSTRVRVNGQDTAVSATGAFAVPVPLRVGDNPVSVEAEDILGRRKTVNQTIRREPRAPVLETQKEDLWKR